MPSPAELTYADLAPDAEFRERYAVTPEVYHGFLATFGDESPLHVSEAFAREAGFTGVVMHGAILNGFVSHFVGMRCPGRRALLLSVELRYHRPVYLGDPLELTARVAQKVDAPQVVVLELRFRAVGRDVEVATGRAQVKLR